MHRQLVASLRGIAHAIELQSKALLRACGLTLPQLLVLAAIRELGDVTARRLSDHVSLTPPTVTTILNRLEERGLVWRDRNAADRRVSHARLTEAGRHLLASAPALLPEAFAARFARLPAWEQTQTLAAVQRLAHMMDVDALEAQAGVEPAL